MRLILVNKQELTISYCESTFEIVLRLFHFELNGKAVYVTQHQSDFDFTLSCIRLPETAFRNISYPSACFCIHSMTFSSLCRSNTLFSQSTSLALHPPQERMAWSFNASSAYCLLDCHCTILPHRDKVHTTPTPTTKEKTLLDLMSKLCLWICSCGCSSCCTFCFVLQLLDRI